jgi:serine/threonine-protein kinase
MAAIMHREPAPLDAPAALKQIVKRCLAKAPGQRYQTMAEIRAALASIPGEHAAPQPSIAVLPFANMSRDADDEYFSDGLAEEIINALAQVPGLKVIARTSAFAFKGKNEDIRKIAEALGVTNVLEGSVRRAGNRLRITAQLIHAADGMHLWSQRFDREMTDVFAIQDEISAAIADQLRVSLAETPAAARAPTKVAAYEAFLEGQYHWNKITPQGFQKALECYGRALAIDPGYAPAYAGMAQSYIMPGQSGMVEPRPFLLKARAAAERALALDADLAEAHAMLGASIALLDYDWAASERHFLRALELNPSSFHVWGPYSTFWLAPQGRVDEALAGFDRVLELDPLNLLADFSKGLFLLHGRKYEAAAVEIRKGLDLNPGFPVARNVLATVYAFQGKSEEALSMAQREVQLSGGQPRSLWMMGLVLAITGRAEEARRVLEDLQGLGRDSYVNPVQVASIYAQLGEKDAAFEWVEKAIEQRVNMLMLKASPIWDPLRSDPRYTALLRRMNLA